METDQTSVYFLQNTLKPLSLFHNIYSLCNSDLLILWIVKCLRERKQELLGNLSVDSLGYKYSVNAIFKKRERERV